MLFATIVVGSLLACSSARLGGEETGQPSVIFPAEETQGDGGAPKKAPTRAGASAQPKPANTALPDPEPLRTPSQWEYVLRYRAGDVSVKSVRLLKYEQPVVTAREMGRFAFELWIGRELIDRVRFDFPMTSADPAPSKRTPLHDPPTFSAGADVERRILVPASPRATRALLVDRATQKTVELPWPPAQK
jgi:hypothetical protein